MADTEKYQRILDALESLLEKKKIQTITVSEIAQKAGIGKGSIYYYFPSKEAILEALINRTYEKPLETAAALSTQTDISPFTRMAMLFQACRNSSAEFLRQRAAKANAETQENALLHQKYLNHVISQLKPALTEIIRQGIESGDIHFSDPAALAEIVLIVLAVKLDNTIAPSDTEGMEQTLHGLVELLEKGTDTPPGSLNYLSLMT
ncbi:MAG: TetR/AcrR family transcriptional regulator [Roseburia sp.]